MIRKKASRGRLLRISVGITMLAILLAGGAALKDKGAKYDSVHEKGEA